MTENFIVDRLIAVLTKLYPEIPIYADDITEEERLGSKSLFMYRNSNRYRASESGHGLIRELYLSYVTVERKEIDIGAVITAVPFHFLDSSEEFAKMEGTDATAMLVTMTFSYPASRC